MHISENETAQKAALLTTHKSTGFQKEHVQFLHFLTRTYVKYAYQQGIGLCNCGLYTPNIIIHLGNVIVNKHVYNSTFVYY